MRLRPAASFALAVVVADGIGACHRAPPEGAIATADASATAPGDADAAILSARCRATDVAFALDEGHGLADLEIGDGVAYPGGYAVGLVHHSGTGRVAAVALLRRDPIGLTRVLDLGPTLGDSPAPRIGWRQGELVAAAYLRPPETPEARRAPPVVRAPGPRAAGGEATRDVTLYAIAQGAVTAAPLSIPQRRDDSLALDLAFAGAAGLLVWDESTSGPRGVIKAAAFTRDHAAPSRDVSPPDSDAELPRVVPEGGGFAVIWIASRLEPGSAPDGSAAEATGEARSYGWLEMVTVDSQGAATGPVRRLTPVNGHVSSYDVEAREPLAVGGGPTLLVVVRDDGETVDGSGGALLRIRVTSEGVDPPVAFATEGLGRGAPSFVSAVDVKVSSAATAAPASAPSTLALAWVASGGQARLLPLDAAGTPAAPPSAEDALDDARALLFMGPMARRESAESSSLLVATPSDSAAQLRVFACGR